jgi:hypothetical protein
MTPPDANEQLTRRILGGLGVRPVGHQDPNTGDPGRTATTPPVPVQRANRLPPWWETKKPVVGPGPQTPAAADDDPAVPVPPKPTRPPRDWLDDILDDNAAPATVEPDDEPEPEPEPAEETDRGEEEQEDKPPAFKSKPGYWPRPHLPTAITHAPDQAAAAISHSTRRLLYNASAAGAGWGLGLYQPLAHALEDCGTSSIGGALVLGIGGTALIAHTWDRRTRHWWPGIAWIARIPLATAVLALALWAPAAS